MSTAPLDSVAQLARAVGLESRHLRHIAAAERRLGPLTFPDDIPRAEVEAAFGPILANLAARRKIASV